MLHLNDNIELPNIEVYSSSADIIRPKFQWANHIYDYIGIQFRVYHIQWCFDEMKLFNFDNNWDVDFLYILEYIQALKLSPREVNDMLIKQMPKTHDLEEVKKWCDNHTNLVLSKCDKIK